jgi:hypothetical protein
MPFAILTIPGVSGDISTHCSFWSGLTFSIDGQRIKAHGFPRTRLTLPGTSGPVDAKVKGGPFRAHPALVVGGTEYATGPPTPTALQVLALLPLLAFVLVHGALGALVALGGVAMNMSNVRGTRSDRSKATLMCATLIAVVAIDTVMVLALRSVVTT